MKKRGQAAMEFLMTYGWAIVVVLAAIGALAYFGVLSPQKLLPARTTFSAPIPNVDNAVISLKTSTVAIAFRNDKGVAIDIPGTGTFTSTYCSGTPALMNITDSSTGMLYNATTDIQNGEGMIITWSCVPTASDAVGSKFSATVSFDYKNTETGQMLEQTGTIDGTFG